MSDVEGNTAHSPLVEPDMKISLIRLLQRLSSQAMRRPPVGFLLQVQQTHAVKVLVVAYPLRWPKGPLASAPHMLREAFSNVRVDVAKSPPRIPEAEVVPPAFQVPVQVRYQRRNGFETWSSRAVSPAPY